MRSSAGDEADLAEFYASTQARLVGAVALLTGSRPEAEDIVQEAFVRLVMSWPKVARYESPEGWVRMVAFRIAASRHRNAGRGRSLLTKLARQSDGPADRHDAADTATDLESALATLPMPTRQTAVLFYLCDLTVAEVARVLNVSEGTVKSRLARARAALADTPALGAHHA